MDDTEIKYYTVVRWDDNLGYYLYMDQDLNKGAKAIERE
jgi:hypothetical protein